jgi:hypothetical protein
MTGPSDDPDPDASPEPTEPQPATTIGVVMAAGTATIHDPLTSRPEDHPFFGSIGRVNAHWAHFEHVLDLIIWDLVVHPAS